MRHTMLPGLLHRPEPPLRAPPAKRAGNLYPLAWTGPSTLLPAHTFREARQPVIGHRRPFCGVVDELVRAGTDAGILV